LTGKRTVINDLVRIHHAFYQDDLDFWISRLEGRNPVLELGCGHGRVTIPLLIAGCDVIGLDLDQESLLYARKASRHKQLSDNNFIQADMLRLPLKGKFGAVIIPCNTYSLFKEAERTRLLGDIHRLLVPEGIFLASVPNPRLISKLHQELSPPESPISEDLETDFLHPQTGNPVQVSSLLSPGPGYLSWEWIYDHLLPDGITERFKQSARHQLSSPDQYREELLEAGFRHNTFLGDFDGTSFQPNSPYLIMICERS
jgi:SAM-dependent methyltransferase